MLEEVLHYKPWEYPPSSLLPEKNSFFVVTLSHRGKHTGKQTLMCVTTKPISFFIVTLLSRTQHALFQIVTSQLRQRDDVTTKKQNTGRRAYPHYFSSLIVRPATIRLLADRIRMLADILIVFENTIRIWMKRYSLCVFPIEKSFKDSWLGVAY